MKYRLIDHTADFRIHVFGTDLKDLFSNAAFAMFDQITIVKDLHSKKKLKINVTGSDWPDLMINWLRELLYFWTGKDDLFKSDLHVITNDIKAVTYHQIQVNHVAGGWESKIIFDV